VDHQLFHVRVSDGRRVVLPAEACKQLGIEVGDTVIVDVAEGKVQLHSFDTTLAEFRALLASKVPPGVSLVDELLAERRAEAARE
jgi:AbrB family looped-hinge helix DNA binding protein